MEHKQHRTDNMVSLYTKRFFIKTNNDTKTQLYEQVRLGKLRKELVDSLYADIQRIDDDGNPIFSNKPTEEEKNIINAISNKRHEVSNEFETALEEMTCQLDACDTYEQEMAVLLSYGVLRPHDLHIETFKQDFEEETKDNK